MEKEMSFHILGIEETKDENAVKMAYRKLLKETNPEDDPEGFKRLRTAYETAAAFAAKPDDEAEPENGGGTEEKTAVDAWIGRVDECYRDVYGRADEQAWRELLEDPVCDGLDTSLEARERLLAYLMNHVYLPQKIWKLLDKNFQIVEDIEFLEEKFPKNFLNYVEYYVGHEGFIRFEYFRRRGAGEENVDGYLDHYFAVKKKTDRNEFEGCGQELDDLAAFGVWHPYEEVERLRLLLAEEDAAGAARLADELEETCGGSMRNDPYIWSYIGRVRYREGKKDEAYAVWTRVLNDYPDYYQAKTGAVSCLMEKGRYWQAREWMMEILELDGRDEEILSRLKEANEALITRLQENPEYHEEGKDIPAGEGAIELAWCLFQNERLDETIRYLENYTPEEGQEYSYTNLFGRVLYQAERYQEARPYLEEWLRMITGTVDDGTQENQRRRSRLGRALYILGGCCYQLGEQEEAAAYVERAAKEADSQQERMGYRQYLAHILCESKQYEQAVDVCDQILEEDENYYPAYLIRQEACYELRKGQQVVDDYHRAVGIFAGYYKPYLMAAQVFFYHNQFEDAKGVIDRAKENGVEFSSCLKLYEVKILRNLAGKKEDRELPLKLCGELMKEIEGETDIEDTSEVEFETALLHWDNDEFQEALSHMAEAIRKNAGRMQYRLVRGNIYLDMKKYNEALTEYAGAEEVYRSSPSLYYNRGLCYEGKKMKVQAAENFEKALELQEGYRDACEKLADYYREKYEDQYKRADFDTSIAYISRQIAVTENCYYLVHRGLIYMNAMELDEAIRDFEKALEYVPEDWAAYNNLGCCYKYLGRFEEAIGYFEKAVEYMEDSKSLLPYSNMADCYEALGDYRKAIESYQKDLKLFPDYTSFWKEIGQLYACLGEYDRAEEAYGHTTKMDDYYSRMGDLWFYQGNGKKALHFYKKGIENAAADKKAERQSDLGQAYMDQLQNYPKAAAWLKRAIARTTDHGDLFDYERYLARAYYLMGKYGPAKEHAKAALEHFKKSGEGTEEDYLAYGPYKPAREGVMGWLYLAMGEREKGMELFGQMDRGYRCKGCRYQGCYEKYLFQGWCYEAMGDQENALLMYREAARLNPHSIAVMCALDNLQKRVDRKK